MRRPSIRLNLALAYALQGDWTVARTVAAQDVAADQLDTRIQQWMTFAKPAWRRTRLRPSPASRRPPPIPASRYVRAYSRSPEATRMAAAEPGGGSDGRTRPAAVLVERARHRGGTGVEAALPPVQARAGDARRRRSGAGRRSAARP